MTIDEKRELAILYLQERLKVFGCVIVVEDYGNRLEIKRGKDLITSLGSSDWKKTDKLEGIVNLIISHLKSQ